MLFTTSYIDVKRIYVTLTNNDVDTVRVIFLEKQSISTAYFSLNSTWFIQIEFIGKHA
jgi:hypothetical protein